MQRALMRPGNIDSQVAAMVCFLLLLLSLNVNIFKTYMVRITRGNTFMAKTKKNTVKEKRHLQLNQCERQCS